MTVRSLLIVTFLALGSVVSSAQEALPKATPASRVRDLAETLLKYQKVPGLSFAIVRRGEPWQEAGLGFADVEQQVPASPTTVYRLASISKSFTAVACLKLWEEGRIDLDADVRIHVPEFPEKPWPITVRQLLGHLGGVRHYKGREFISSRIYTDSIAPLAIFKDDPLLHQPGSQFLYTTYGYNLLGAVVERAAGRPFSQYVKHAVLDPSGVRTMEPDDPQRIIPNRTRFYRRDQDLVHADFTNTSNKIPGGGFCATAGDLVRFAKTLMAGELLKPETLDLMWTEGRTSEEKGTGYGLGWSAPGGRRAGTFLHTGGQQGTSTVLLLHRSSKSAVAVMTNLEGVRGLVSLAQAMLDVALE